MVPPFRLNDLLKAHTEFADLSLSSRTYVLAMNKPAYERLPRDLQTVLDNNSTELAAGMAGAMWDIQAQAIAENVAESGDVIVTLLPEAVAHWRKATEPVVTAWLKDMKEAKVDGAKMIASAHALLAKYAILPEPQPPQPPPRQEAVTEPQQPRSAGVTTVPDSAASPSPPPIAKPAPPPPHIATQTPASAAPIAKPAAAVPSVPSLPKPSHAPPPRFATPAAAPATTAPVAQPVPTVSAVPVAKPVPPPAPVATPAPAPPPKALNIPL
jgi:hypothetical protein